MAGGVTTSPQPPLDSYKNRFLRHRNSISQSPLIVPAVCKLHHQSPSPSDTSTSSTATSSSSPSSSSKSSGEFDLITIKPVPYTSLRDILHSTAVNSPKPKSPGSEISIRNHLVKQAAWAYLQPMSTSPDSSGRNFFHRTWAQFTSKSPVAAFFRFFDRHVFRRINWAIRIIRVRSSR